MSKENYVITIYSSHQICIMIFHGVSSFVTDNWSTWNVVASNTSLTVLFTDSVYFLCTSLFSYKNSSHPTGSSTTTGPIAEWIAQAFASSVTCINKSTVALC